MSLLKIGALAIAATPLVATSAVVIVARVWKVNLLPMLPWLHGLRWVAWIMGIAVALAALVLNQPFAWLGISMLGASAGFGGIEGWLKRRYAPEEWPSESQDGWWPTVR